MLPRTVGVPASRRQALAEYSALENFWRRYNTALLDRTALALQKADLRSENQQLQKMLRDYLENLRAGTVTKAEGILPQVRQTQSDRAARLLGADQGNAAVFFFTGVTRKCLFIVILGRVDGCQLRPNMRMCIGSVAYTTRDGCSDLCL